METPEAITGLSLEMLAGTLVLAGTIRRIHMRLTELSVEGRQGLFGRKVEVPQGVRVDCHQRDYCKQSTLEQGEGGQEPKGTNILFTSLKQITPPPFSHLGILCQTNDRSSEPFPFSAKVEPRDLFVLGKPSTAELYLSYFHFERRSS